MKVLLIKEISGAGNHFIDLINDENGNQVPSTIYLQLLNADNMKVAGVIKDSEDIAPADLSLISLNDYSILKTATAPGLYVVDGSGLSSININLTNGEKVIVKVNY